VPLAAYDGASRWRGAGPGAFGASVRSQFEDYLRERQEHGLDHWQQSFELGPEQAGAPRNTITLVARGAASCRAMQAWLLVFDDISEIVSAQRAQAWGEVARRLAHEIKNPLTPIQLSAERLEMKLTGKLAEPEQAMLTKSVKTIVDQVDAMKRLVNEFRDYARLPAAELKPVDLNALVADVLQLYLGEAATAGQACPCTWSWTPPARPSWATRSSCARSSTTCCKTPRTPPKGARCARSRSRPSGTPPRAACAWWCRTAAPAFPTHILKRAFEPYVTTKAKGTGLGLAVVKKIADEHGARIDLSNRTDGVVRGAQVSLSFAVAA
jgi:nitrogen fixation/metabolism regulation signal transduction histidine kinase